MLVSFVGVEGAALPSAGACGDGGREYRGVATGLGLDRENGSACNVGLFLAGSDCSQRGGVSGQAGITAIVLGAFPGSAAQGARKRR